MRNCIIVLLIVLFFSSCSSEDSHDKTLWDRISSSFSDDTTKFEINGSIRNYDGSFIYLEKMNTDKPPETIDSTIINEKGEFYFKHSIKTTAYYIIRIRGNEFVTLLINPSEKIEFVADATDFTNKYIVNGSPDSRLIYDLNRTRSKTLNRIDSISIVYREFQEHQSIDSIKRHLDSIYVTVMSSQQDYLRSFIDKNPNSLTCVWALFQQVDKHGMILSPEFDKKYYKKVRDNLSQLYPESQYVKSLAEFIKKHKQKKTKGQKKELKYSVGKQAPNISMPGINGDTLRLSFFRGSYVLISFWASWSPESRNENKNIVELYRKYYNAGFRIFQISLDKSKDKWLAAIQEDYLQYFAHVSDLKYWQSEPAKLFGIKRLPSNFLIDNEGKIVAKDILGKDLDERLAEIYGF